nr:hypothetical protein [Tanacetum cinerariifolium]
MHHGCDHRDFDIGEFGGKTVFFEDGFVGPAIRPVKLGNQRLLFVDTDLVDAVLVAVQREDAGVGDEADALDGVFGEGRAAIFAGVLNAYEQRFLIGRKADAGDLTADWPHHEPSDFAAGRVRAQHLVVAHAREITCVGGVAIGQDPQPPGHIEAQPVGAVEHILRVDIARTALRCSGMPVHSRRLDLARRQSGMDQHFSLAGKSAGGVDAVFAMGQLNPSALAFGAIRVAVAAIELRNVQRAVVEDVAVGLGILMVDLVAADEFVDELAALVVAHVHHDASVFGFGQRGVFVLEAAQRSAFDRCGFGVERIDLDHPAMAIGFVGVFGDVEARIVQVPVHFFTGGCDAITLGRGIKGLRRVAAAEAVGKVLFAGQVRAPRRLAVGAVLESTEHVLARFVSGGFQPFVPCGRATEVAVIGVLVVDCHQRAAGRLWLVAGEGEQAHAVIVVAELHLLHLRRAFAAGVERRTAGVQRLTPTDQDR